LVKQHASITISFMHELEGQFLRTHRTIASHQSTIESPDNLPPHSGIPPELLSLDGADITITSTHSKTSNSTGRKLWNMPEGAMLEEHPNRDFTGLTDEYQVLWQGDFVRDGQIVETLVFLARWATAAERSEDHTIETARVKAALLTQ
jgi:hypothetical protein